MEVIYPGPLDEYDWFLIDQKGWLEVTLRHDGRSRAVTFYDAARLAQTVEGDVRGRGYFVEQALVVLPKLTREAIESVASRIMAHLTA
jgi:hypothetical protein